MSLSSMYWLLDWARRGLCDSYFIFVFLSFIGLLVNGLVDLNIIVKLSIFISAFICLAYVFLVDLHMQKKKNVYVHQTPS